MGSNNRDLLPKAQEREEVVFGTLCKGAADGSYRLQ